MRADTLRVLLIEDNVDAAVLVKAALRDGGLGQPEIEWMEDLRTGLNRLTTSGFDAVLLDLNLPDSEGFETFTRVRRAAPGSAVIVLTGDEDESLALKSVRAGAEEYLLKRDITPVLLSRRLRYAVERNRANRANSAAEARRGKLIAMIGAKGGCGTTTLAINLGYALKQLGPTVIGVELGDEPGFSGHLAIPPQKHRGAIGDPSDVSPETLEPLLVRLCSGLSLLCSPEFDSRVSLDETMATAIVQACCRKADYVLVDCPSQIRAPTIAVLKDSDIIYFLLERSYIGLRCAKQRMEVLAANGVDSSKLHAVVVNKSTFFESVGIDTIRAELRCDNLFALPPGSEELSRKSDVLSPNGPPSDSLYADTIRQLASNLSRSFGGAAPAEGYAAQRLQPLS